MRILFFSLAISIVLLASNPKVFAALGDVIYDNASKIEKLKDIDEFEKYNEKIENYLQNVQTTKERGYILQKYPNAKLRKEYLISLRKLVKTNDFFVRLANKRYEEAKEDNNTTAFIQILNTGLIDSELHKKEIIDYYFSHNGEINATGTVIEIFLNEDKKLKEKKAKEYKRKKSKREKERERIQYLRQKDKLQQERLQKKLEEELKEKKERIQEEQKEELSKTI